VERPALLSRQYATIPIPRKPKIIIAQVAGSGTAVIETETWPGLSPVDSEFCNNVRSLLDNVYVAPEPSSLGITNPEGLGSSFCREANPIHGAAGTAHVMQDGNAAPDRCADVPAGRAAP
jgi:hypothetical protein